MIKKYIPEKFDLQTIDIFEIIRNVAGNVPITLTGRIIEIDADLTNEQKQQIRNDFIASVEEVGDITV